MAVFTGRLLTDSTLGPAAPLAGGSRRSANLPFNPANGKIIVKFKFHHRKVFPQDPDGNVVEVHQPNMF